jgi:hypothetical protein
MSSTVRKSRAVEKIPAQESYWLKLSPDNVSEEFGGPFPVFLLALEKKIQGRLGTFLELSADLPHAEKYEIGQIAVVGDGGRILDTFVLRGPNGGLVLEGGAGRLTLNHAVEMGDEFPSLRFLIEIDFAGHMHLNVHHHIYHRDPDQPKSAWAAGGPADPSDDFVRWGAVGQIPAQRTYTLRILPGDPEGVVPNVFPLRRDDPHRTGPPVHLNAGLPYVKSYEVDTLVVEGDGGRVLEEFEIAGGVTLEDGDGDFCVCYRPDGDGYEKTSSVLIRFEGRVVPRGRGAKYTVEAVPAESPGFGHSWVHVIGPADIARLEEHMGPDPEPAVIEPSDK